MEIERALEMLPKIRMTYGTAQLERYSQTAMDWFNVVEDLLELAIAERPIIVPEDDECVYTHHACPNCGEWLMGEPNFCRCGQKLDWSKDEN